MRFLTAVLTRVSVAAVANVPEKFQSGTELKNFLSEIYNEVHGQLQPLWIITTAAVS